MESILLGALAVTGYNSSKKNKNPNKKTYDQNELNSTYKSNIENTMNKLEKIQASTLKENKPEYFTQFDQLTFDSISDPVTIADAHITITGLDTGMQKAINFYNGYSNVQDDLNYQVVSKEKFTHKNMAPNTSRRDYTIADDTRATRRLEAFTGVNDNWVPKQEKYPLFEPMKNLSYVQGMPVFTDYLDDRYLASNKNNNGNLPFTNNVFVRPGLDGQTRQGLGTVYRVNPRTTDALRGDNNPKISYLNKPLETIKKGEMRGVDYNITKYKLPDFRIQNFTDLVPNKAEITGRIKTGKFTNIATQRNEAEVYYPGHATNTNMGDGPDKTKTSFSAAKRQELYNDPTHAVNAVNVRPVFTNAESYPNRDNQRTTANYSGTGFVSASDEGSWVPYSDLARQTIRETSSHNVILGANPEFTGPNAIYNDKARQTIRETSSHNVILGANVEVAGPNATYDDKARRTMRETTSHNVILGANPEIAGPNAIYEDKARRTIRETTNHNVILGANPEIAGPNATYVDNARQTIREKTSHNVILGANVEVAGPNAVYDDKARQTIRETTSHNVILGASVEVAGPSAVYDDKARQTIRETTSHNVILGASADVAGPNATYEDNARKTIREGTSHNVILGASADVPGPNNTYVDKAKPTIKQSTLYTTPGMNVTSSVPVTYARDARDKAKTTHRETTEDTIYEGPLHGVDNYAGYTRDARDKARTTVKETTLLTDYHGGLSGPVERPESHIAADNMTIRETREISMYNRPANGGADRAGPQFNKETLRTNCKRDTVYYVSHPSRPLDQSVMPSGTEQYKHKCIENKKPQLSYGNYYTNNAFINTLNQNPYVNDLHHQKNVQYDDYKLFK